MQNSTLMMQSQPPANIQAPALEHEFENHDQTHNEDVQQYVTFQVEREVFAVLIEDVQEIILMPDVVRVPLSPPSLEGLANLRGTVLPVINLRDIFHFSRVQHDDATRVIVIQQQSVSIGFVVDRVVSVVTVETDKIESVSHIQSTVNVDLLSGMIKNIANHAMIMILDLNRLIHTEFRTIIAGAHALANKNFNGLNNGQGDVVSRQNINDDEIQLVSFGVAGQEYALPIEAVQEIVQVPEEISHIPKSESHVIGVMTLRNRLLPLVSLREIFGLSTAPLTEHNRIVVTSLKEQEIAKIKGKQLELSVGIVMDTVKEVLRVNRNIVDPLPTLLTSKQAQGEIQSICRINSGKRLVSILSAEKIFQNRTVRNVIENNLDTHLVKNIEGEQDMEHDLSLNLDDEEQFVVFILADEEYAVPIDSVQEIVRIPDEMTHVPCAPDFIEGVVNLRGTVLPIIDQRARFGLNHQERNDRQRIMVFTINDIRTGFIVDSVAEVLKIPKSVIGPAPNLSEMQARLITRIANLEVTKRIILLIDVQQLLDKTEISAITETLS